MDFLTELKCWFDRQVDGESSDISCVLSPYLLTIYYRGEPVGSWRATREGARWHDRHKEEDATRVVLRDVYDAIEHTKRAQSARCFSLCEMSKIAEGEGKSQRHFPLYPGSHFRLEHGELASHERVAVPLDVLPVLREPDDPMMIAPKK